MESYQNQESNISFSNKEKKSAWSSVAKYTAIVGAVGATAMLAYTANNGTLHLSSEQRIALAKTGRSHVRYSTLSETETQKLFDDFKAQFGKSYATPEEESERFNAFTLFLRKAEARNDKEVKNGGTAVHGITKFADRSDEEFKALLGYKKETKNLNDYAIGGQLKTLTLADYDLTKAKDTTVVDWTDILTTPVKDQGYCGSCWAFSATSQIESDAIRAGYLTTSDALSPQQIVSCDRNDAGCDGGWTEYAYYYVYSANGLVSNSDYPYTSYYDETGSCLISDSMTKLVTVDEYYTLDSEETMAAHIMTTGPLSICLDASEWASYTSGVVTSCTTDVDHCVQLVGLNSDEGYWIVRNSWGTSWGVNGMIYLEYGSDLCAITTDPTYVEVVQV